MKDTVDVKRLKRETKVTVLRYERKKSRKEY